MQHNGTGQENLNEFYKKKKIIPINNEFKLLK